MVSSGNFSRGFSHVTSSPPRGNEENICSILGVQDSCETFDEFNEEVTADLRSDDFLQGATATIRESIVGELIRGGSGLGPAGHAAVVSTAPEVVGVTGNGVGAFYTKGSELQSNEAGNNVNGTRAVGNTTHALPVYNTQSCGPRARREATMALSGRACAIPPQRRRRRKSDQPSYALLSA